MLIPLRQSTAVNLKLGPLLDRTDAVTRETALTIPQSEIFLFKNNGAGAQKNDATAATHDARGFWVVPLNTTDTNTLGRLTIDIENAGALPASFECFVYQANVFDSLFAGTDFLETTGLAQDFSISGATLTHRKRDGSTTQGTKTITTTAGADPVTGLD